jgi:3-oxoacyl-[acyl-carrier-protein] synthase-1
MKPLSISACTVTSALGAGREAHARALLESRTGLDRCKFDLCALDCWVGEVEGLEEPLTGALARWDCRNNRLAALALRQDGFDDRVRALIARFGADRVGLFIGTSTSGIQQTELAYRARDRAANRLPDWFDFDHTHSTFAAAEFVATVLGISGVRAVVSTACSSSAKVFASAHRAMEAGLCDVAVVGGVDTLCLMTLHGFHALQLVAPAPCRPADIERSGISIGECAGFAILEHGASIDIGLLGYGESNDAYHMSSPEPSGRGAAAAMRAALQRAGLSAEAIDYVNLHGTGTIANDLAEDRAVCAVLGATVPCSSTKGWTGHTLGAAGILEAVISILCVEHGLLPRSLNTRTKDPALHGNILLANARRPVARVMSNSFGFGGSNCALILGRPQ